MNEIDKKYMLEALKLAETAYAIGEVPVGAVIIKNNKILGKAYNKKETDGVATHHAEMLAIKKASKKNKNWRLNGSTIYITLEPCKMCMAAIEEARIEKVIFGTTENKNKVTTSKQIKEIIKDESIRKRSKDLLKSFFENKRK